MCKLNICPECIIRVGNYNKNALELIFKSIISESDFAYDGRGLAYKVGKKGHVKPLYMLINAVKLLEKKGYVVSTEISKDLIAIRINFENADFDEESHTICWCETEYK
jgi:hypothetical protein